MQLFWTFSVWCAVDWNQFQFQSLPFQDPISYSQRWKVESKLPERFFLDFSEKERISDSGDFAFSQMLPKSPGVAKKCNTHKVPFLALVSICLLFFPWSHINYRDNTEKKAPMNPIYHSSWPKVASTYQVKEGFSWLEPRRNLGCEQDKCDCV